MRPEQALAKADGDYWAPAAGRKMSDVYVVTVYGLGEPRLWNGRWEFPHFVARVEWLTGRAGPGKDRAVLERELSELGYRLVRGPEPLDQSTSEAVVRPIY